MNNIANNSPKIRADKIDEVYRSFSSKDRIARLEVLCERSVDAKRMLRRLREIQLRMGTCEEGSGDQDEVESIAHQLNNMLMLCVDDMG